MRLPSCFRAFVVAFAVVLAGAAFGQNPAIRPDGPPPGRAGRARSARRHGRGCRARPTSPRRATRAHRAGAAGSPGSGQAARPVRGPKPGLAGLRAGRRPRPAVRAQPNRAAAHGQAETPKQGSFDLFPSNEAEAPKTARVLQFRSTGLRHLEQRFRDDVIRTLIRLRLIPK